MGPHDTAAVTLGNTGFAQSIINYIPNKNTLLCLGLRLAQIKCLLDEINNKLDILLQTPIQSAIRIFKTTLNTLKLGEMRNALEELKEAKSKAHDALSIFEMVIRLD